MTSLAFENRHVKAAYISQGITKLKAKLASPADKRLFLNREVSGSDLAVSIALL